VLDRELIRKNPDLVRQGILRKRLDPTIVDRFLAADQLWRSAVSSVETKQASANAVAKTIGQLMGQGKRDEAEEAKTQSKQLKEQLQQEEKATRELELDLRRLELEFPNLPHASTPIGDGEEDNPVVRTWGEKPSFEFAPQAHWDLGEALKLFDLPKGAKVAGSGFVVYTGIGARLQRALFSYMVDLQTSIGGYEEIYPPYLSNSASLTGTGNLPKFEEDLYKVDDDLYLIPTAEVPLTNLYREEILDVKALPIKIAGYSGCFRREAGAAGKDTRGLLRIHQFDKVEMVKFCKPEDSYGELESLTADAERVLQTLGLHYRVIELCTGDIGAKAAKAYDVELWAPGVGKYLEISSCSNFEDYQSRRANIRFRREPGAKPEFVHILNGSGLAVPRLYAALLETGQQADGSVVIPDPLVPYLGVSRISRLS
jgi:seryl-tRNA synthetase